MTEPNYEAIGRYTHLVGELDSLSMKRRSLFTRIVGVLKNANENPLESKVPRKCNFEAVRDLLDEAEALDKAIRFTVDQVNELAPLADKSAIS
ncbi:hypothetical protein D9M69_664230 [compost metagenome]